MEIKVDGVSSTKIYINTLNQAEANTITSPLYYTMYNKIVENEKEK